MEHNLRRFLDTLLTGEDGVRRNRQLKDAEFGNKGIGNLQELMGETGIC